MRLDKHEMEMYEFRSKFLDQLSSYWFNKKDSFPWSYFILMAWRQTLTTYISNSFNSSKMEWLHTYFRVGVPKLLYWKFTWQWIGKGSTITWPFPCLCSTTAHQFARTCWEDTSCCSYSYKCHAYILLCMDWTWIQKWYIPSYLQCPHWTSINCSVQVTENLI